MAPRLDDENPAPTVETDETPNVMPPHTVLAISPHPTSIRPRTCPPFPHTQPARVLPLRAMRLSLVLSAPPHLPCAILQVNEKPPAAPDGGAHVQENVMPVMPHAVRVRVRVIGLYGLES